jgi:hypothetical protein
VYAFRSMDPRLCGKPRLFSGGDEMLAERLSRAARDSLRNVIKYLGIVRQAGISRPSPAMMTIASKTLLFPLAHNISISAD